MTILSALVWLVLKTILILAPIVVTGQRINRKQSFTVIMKDGKLFLKEGI